jgi:hypothetical protein
VTSVTDTFFAAAYDRHGFPESSEQTTIQVIGMARKYWRLLAALSLILLAPAFLRGQEAVEDRIRFLVPKLKTLRPSPPVISGRISLFPTLPRQSPVVSETLAFDRIVGAAGIIFSGRVTSIGRASLPLGEETSSTKVTFQVDHAIRGIPAGQAFTLHEWAGLWNGGERYHVGEHLLLFLYPPGKLGLTSPVAGAMGRFVLDSEDRILINAEHSASLEKDPILGRKTVVRYVDFVAAVRRSGRGVSEP